MKTPTGQGKAYSRRLESFVLGTNHRVEEGLVINFGPVDLKGLTTPYEDALVMRAIIANYEVARVFVDSESSVNILFKEAFDHMQIDSAKLHPLSTLLFGFVHPLRQISLSLSLGEGPLRRTRSTDFIVVKIISSYNVILGRPALSVFKTVASTYYQKVKS